MAETLVTSFNTGVVPVIEQAAATMVKDSCARAVAQAIDVYQTVSITKIN